MTLQDFTSENKISKETIYEENLDANLHQHVSILKVDDAIFAVFSDCYNEAAVMLTAQRDVRLLSSADGFWTCLDDDFGAEVKRALDSL